MEREAADHYFGDPHTNGSPHPDARPPLEPLDVALDRFLEQHGSNDWRVKFDGDAYVEIQVYDTEAPGCYVVREDGTHERLPDE